MKLITAAQMRKLESYAIDDLGIPSLLLMENAAQAVVKHVLTLAKANQKEVSKATTVAVYCGPGNNGGDGFAIARLLYTEGFNVHVILIGDIEKFENNLSKDATLNLQVVQKLNCIMRHSISPDIIVDAIFGIGLKGAVTDTTEQPSTSAQAIKTINQANVPVISVDIPSGVNADTGKVEGIAVKAQTTVTFAMAKLGHILYPGTEYTGQLFVENISIPKHIYSKEHNESYQEKPEENYIEMLDDTKAIKMLPKRLPRSNKGTHGRVCVIAGSENMPGAAVLCCKAAYKAGAGLVDACVVNSVATILHNSAPEVITSATSSIGLENAIKQASVVAIGPGLGRTEKASNLVVKAINFCNKYDKTMVIDADGLMAIAANKEILNGLKVPCIITPHPGEMAALTGTNIQDVLDDIISCARNFSQSYNTITLLKDARTIIASPSKRIFINPTGTSALAKAGSGDVLTGIIAAFVAQGLEAHTAAVLGAYVHGKAGQMAAEAHSLYGVNASDIIEHIVSMIHAQ